jgi:hypothetical protein
MAYDGRATPYSSHADPQSASRGRPFVSPFLLILSSIIPIQVTKLMGHEPLTKYCVLLVVLLQFGIAYALRRTYPLSPLFLLTAYAIGGTANHNLFLAIHEITHNLAFRSVWANKALAIFANLPIGIPYSAAFKVRSSLSPQYGISSTARYISQKYHIEHHKHLGEDGIDTDLPSRIELLLLNSVAGKAFFATFQIIFYALRPTFTRVQSPTVWHFANILAQIVFDIVLVRVAGTNALLYLLLSSFFAGSLHPCAGHFIAEHYLWDGLNQETYSYYGSLNLVAYNVRSFTGLPCSEPQAFHSDTRSDITMSIMTSPLSHGRGCLRCGHLHPSSTTRFLRTHLGPWSSSTLCATLKLVCFRARRGLGRGLNKIDRKTIIFSRKTSIDTF